MQCLAVPAPLHKSAGGRKGGRGVDPPGGVRLAAQALNPLIFHHRVGMANPLNALGFLAIVRLGL
jgi:hypothetical protein